MEECIARYGEAKTYEPIQLPEDFGKAISEHSGETDGELPYPEKFLSFKKSGYEVVVGFHRSRVVHIQYFPEDHKKRISKEELFSLLETNGSGREWIMSTTKLFPFSPAKDGELPSHNHLTLWTTDGELWATCSPEGSKVIVIMNSKLRPRFKPKLSKEDKARLNNL